MTGSLTPGRRYPLSHVRRLHPSRQPDPFDPYPINATIRAEGIPVAQGQGLARRANDGTRWCPYCQTVLRPRARACDACRPRRRAALEGNRPRGPRPRGTSDQDLLERLLAEVDRLIATTHRVPLTGPTGTEVRWGSLELVFMACKEIEVVSSLLRDGAE